MGIDPKTLRDNVLNKISKADRGPVLTAAEATLKGAAAEERKEQKTFHNWLLLAEGRGELWFDPSPPHKRSTARLGKPDFLIAPFGKAAFWIEFKSAGGRFSPEQTKTIELLRALGHRVYIARSAEQAITLIREVLAE